MHVDIDEPVEITTYDARWPSWYANDAAEVRQVLGSRVQALEHFGSTAIVGLVAKPIIDILVAPVRWPLDPADRRSLESLGYQYLGEANVPGREYFRRRSSHATNLAVVEWGSPLWRDNITVRDYLRSHPEVAASYGQTKLRVWTDGARTLLGYSEAKSSHIGSLVAAAKRWRAA